MNKRKNNKHRTVVISIPCLLIGGTENQTLYLVRALCELKFRVIIGCYFEWDPLMVDEYRKVGAIVCLLSPEATKNQFVNDKWARPKGLKKIFFLWHSLRGIMKLYRPEIAHVQYMDPGALPIMLFKLLGIRYLFATVHQSGAPYGKFHNLYLRMAASFTTRFTGISKHVLDSWFGDKWPHNVVLLYNTIDLDRINRIRANTNVDQVKMKLGIEGKQVIGTVARLSHIKGVDLLLDSYSLIYKEMQDSILLIVGDGNCRAELEAKARNLGINDRIIWMGKQSPDETISLEQIFDICVCPSRYEGFGLIALEALSSGIPVVAFRVGGLPEVVEDKVNGILISPGDVTGLAQTCSMLLDNKVLRAQLGGNGKAVADKYGYETYKNAVRDLYQPFS
ncbi:MAG: glycosyltransferase family 4 protein [Bacteroidota bacterium]|nr:glycosyltransferase family 4 protein [Bacteroidota bacterium]